MCGYVTSPKCILVFLTASLPSLPSPPSPSPPIPSLLSYSLSPPAGSCPQSRQHCSRPCRRSPRSTSVCPWRTRSSCGSCTTATWAAHAAYRPPRHFTHPATRPPSPQPPSPRDNPPKAVDTPRPAFSLPKPQPWAPYTSKDSTASPRHLTSRYSLKLSHLKLSPKKHILNGLSFFMESRYHCFLLYSFQKDFKDTVKSRSQI